MSGRIPPRAVWRSAVEHDANLSAQARAAGLAVDNANGQQASADTAALAELETAGYLHRCDSGFILRHYKSIARLNGYRVA